MALRLSLVQLVVSIRDLPSRPIFRSDHFTATFLVPTPRKPPTETTTEWTAPLASRKAPATAPTAPVAAWARLARVASTRRRIRAAVAENLPGHLGVAMGIRRHRLQLVLVGVETARR